MQVLLDFLRRYNYLFLFLILEIFSILMLVRFNRYQGYVWLTGANEVAASVNGAYTGAVAFTELREVNRSLTDANIRLQQENHALREALADTKYDTTYTHRRVLDELQGYRLIPARVVGNKIRVGADNYLVIDRGSSDGVTAEMGVVSGGGVVGIVYLTGRHHSLVMPVTHSKSSISCSVRGQNYFGYLQWDGSNTRTAYVADVPRYAKAHKGQVIETSGYSSVFPPGIFVGRIHKVSNASDGQSYRLDVVLGNDFASLRDVSVVATPYKSEIDTLRRRAEFIDMNSED